MNKSLFIIVLLFWGISEVKAQNQDGYQLSIGLLSESVYHFGLNVGTEISLGFKERVKQKKQREITKHRTFLVKPQIGFYVHKQNHTGVIINAELAIRRQKAHRKWMHTWALGVGIVSQFNAGITYVSQNDGTVKAKKFASRTYFNPSVSYEIGQRINEKIAWYAKPTLGFKVPYNTFFSILPLLEIGFKLNFKRTQND